MPVGLIFFVAILALIAYVVTTRIRQMCEQAELQRQHPGEPWMWRRDWAGRSVRNETTVTAGLLWFFAILWILMSLPALFSFRGRMQQDRIIFYFVWLFPAVGCIVLLIAAYQTLRRRKYGTSLCRLERLPIPVGSVFRGEVQARVRDVPASGFQVRLVCVRRVITGSGKNRSVRETILWEDEKTVGSGAAMPNPDGMRIPLQFAIPQDCEPTDESNSRDSILWRVDVRADVPGIDYAARFQLPVFGTANAPQDDQWPVQPATSWTPPTTITFELSRTGGEQIIIRPSVRFGDWFGYLFFVLLWFGALAMFQRFGAPIWIISIFAIFGTIVLAAALDILLGRSAISADRQMLTSRRSWLGIGRTRTFAANDVESVVSRIGTSSGDRARYNIEAQFRDGRKVRIAKHLANKRDADGVAARVWRALGH